MASDSVDPVAALLSVLLIDGVILGLAIGGFWAGVFVARRLGHPAGYGLGALGLSKPKLGYFAAAKLGLVVGIGALAVNFVVFPLSVFTLDELGYSTERTVQEPLMRGIQGWVGAQPEIAIPTTIFVIVLFAPAVEEVIFRGVVYGSLRKLVALLSGRLQRLGKGTDRITGIISFIFAALGSSALFAVLHLELVLLPALFALAIALCVLYERTDSLLPCFVAHASFNSFAVLIIILSGTRVLTMQV
ncbi:MAG: CPBP family intramembrane metalloprotease [Rubrobacter sp.]|nr:CPBP family intramembrane metalloprotease [Rubrobacter sp.]